MVKISSKPNWLKPPRKVIFGEARVECSNNKLTGCWPKKFNPAIFPKTKSGPKRKINPTTKKKLFSYLVA